jgi:hypothetical protein
MDKDTKTLLRARASNWLRQSRHRARKRGCTVDLTLDEVEQVMEHHDYTCPTTGEPGVPTLMYPVCLGGPLVQANVTLTPRGTNILYRNHDEWPEMGYGTADDVEARNQTSKCFMGYEHVRPLIAGI